MKSGLSDMISRGIGIIVILLILLAIALCLVAPIFGPLIKQQQRHAYIMCNDYEQRAEADMRIIRQILWCIAIIGWGYIIYANMHGYAN